MNDEYKIKRLTEIIKIIFNKGTKSNSLNAYIIPYYILSAYEKELKELI